MIPVRCYTCNKVLAQHQQQFKHLKRSKPLKKVLEDIGIHRMCCRRMLIGHVDLITEQMQYPNNDIVLESGVVMKKLCVDEQTSKCD